MYVHVNAEIKSSKAFNRHKMNISLCGTSQSRARQGWCWLTQAFPGMGEHCPAHSCSVGAGEEEDPGFQI